MALLDRRANGEDIALFQQPPKALLDRRTNGKDHSQYTIPPISNPQRLSSTGVPMENPPPTITVYGACARLSLLRGHGGKRTQNTAS